jgi:hypothetical protein
VIRSNEAEVDAVAGDIFVVLTFLGIFIGKNESHTVDVA